VALDFSRDYEKACDCHRPKEMAVERNEKEIEIKINANF